MPKAAKVAFAAADAASPGHARAVLGLAVTDGAGPDAMARVAAACDTLEHAGKLGERALVLAAAHAWAGHGAHALEVAEQAIASPAQDPTGWSLPADPIFAPLRTADGYARLAARLAARAS